jgi:hypothetical protein
MQSWNMKFMLFLVDARPFDEIRVSLDEMFGGRFEQDLEYKSDGILRYTNYVFGVLISCLAEEVWSEGQVYRFSGINDNCCRFDTLQEMDMEFHVRKLLSSLELTRIMTFDEFHDESQRRRKST